MSPSRGPDPLALALNRCMRSKLHLLEVQRELDKGAERGQGGGQGGAGAGDHAAGGDAGAGAARRAADAPGRRVLGKGAGGADTDQGNAVIYLQDSDFTLYNGDALEVLRTLPDESVHMCVTSPPFYGLRDYGTGTWEAPQSLSEAGRVPASREKNETASPASESDWTTCEHRVRPKGSGRGSSTLGNWKSGGGQLANSGHQLEGYKSTCGRCGATRIDRQIGLEETPEQWVQKLVEVFREVRRVLRRDGTLWLEVGDSYAGSWGAQSRESGKGLDSLSAGQIASHPKQTQTGTIRSPGLKPKDLIGAPWLLAFALRADGWYLRSDIVWSRPNPMPESVTDRPTKGHSYVFLLAKSPRYYYDLEAIREQEKPWNNGRMAAPSKHESNIAGGVQGYVQRKHQYEEIKGANARSVWNIATQPYPEAHFATYPEELVRRCILAGSRPGDTILDCFSGSGTTALVARKHGRKCIGIELSADYCELTARRLQQLSLLSEAGA